MTVMDTSRLVVLGAVLLVMAAYAGLVVYMRRKTPKNKRGEGHRDSAVGHANSASNILRD